MEPAKAKILTCPICGREKEILQLMSGNTLHSRQWSDCKQDCPMFPRVSMVQKCPHCGHYYLITRQYNYKESESYSNETGQLNFHELCEALNELEKENLTSEEHFNIMLMTVWAYNDNFRYGKPVISLEETDKEFFHKIVLSLIPMCKEIEMKAELYREIRMFDESIAEIDSRLSKPCDDFLRSILLKMRCKAKKKNVISRKYNDRFNRLGMDRT